MLGMCSCHHKHMGGTEIRREDSNEAREAQLGIILWLSEINPMMHEVGLHWCVLPLYDKV